MRIIIYLFCLASALGAGRVGFSTELDLVCPLALDSGPESESSQALFVAVAKVFAKVTGVESAEPYVVNHQIDFVLNKILSPVEFEQFWREVPHLSAFDRTRETQIRMRAHFQASLLELRKILLSEDADLARVVAKLDERVTARGFAKNERTPLDTPATLPHLDLAGFDSLLHFFARVTQQGTLPLLFPRALSKLTTLYIKSSEQDGLLRHFKTLTFNQESEERARRAFVAGDYDKPPLTTLAAAWGMFLVHALPGTNVEHLTLGQVFEILLEKKSMRPVPPTRWGLSRKLRDPGTIDNDSVLRFSEDTQRELNQAGIKDFDELIQSWDRRRFSSASMFGVETEQDVIIMVEPKTYRVVLAEVLRIEITKIHADQSGAEWQYFSAQGKELKINQVKFRIANQLFMLPADVTAKFHLRYKVPTASLFYLLENSDHEVVDDNTWKLTARKAPVVLRMEFSGKKNQLRVTALKR